MLAPRNYKRISNRMLKPSASSKNGPTFTDLMHDLRGANQPDLLYALTVASAIPIADAIRGYHETLDLVEPELIKVHANRATSLATEPRKASAVLAESRRIEPVVRDRDVLLIDQYIGSGGTLELGRTMLRCAGARGIRSDRSVRWYDQAVHSEVDTDKLTSEHADFMHEIGELAAKASLSRHSAIAPQHYVVPAIR